MSNFVFAPSTGDFSPKNRKIGMKKNTLLKIIVIIGLFLVYVPLFTIPLFIVNLFIYKRPIITSFIIPLNWDDEKAICILNPLPKKEEQVKVDEYFKTYLNTDINQIKKTYEPLANYQE